MVLFALYQHLRVLNDPVPRAVRTTLYHTLGGVLKLCQNDASARAWIDAFFFGVSAMVGSDERMVLNLGHPIAQTVTHPSTSTVFTGIIDYTADMASKPSACELIILREEKLINRLQ